MEVLIISYFNSWLTHFGTEMELAQRHLDSGDEVVFLGCDRALTCCEANPRGKISKCDRCRLRRAAALALLSAPVREYALGDFLPAGESREALATVCGRLVDNASADAFVFNGHDLGSAALSSAIWLRRDPFCANPGSPAVLEAFAGAAVRSYLAVRDFLKACPEIGKAYVFNGRLATTRGALRACQEAPGLEVVTHERGSSPAKFRLVSNAMPHDRAPWVRETLAAWQGAPDRDEAMAVGSGFYHNRRAGTNTEWISFIDRQVTAKLPPTWDATKRNIVIFNSSEDEFVGLGEEWLNPVYPMQSEGVRRIVVDARKRYPDAFFHLRMHPNLAGVDNRDTRASLALGDGTHPSLAVVPPEADISTYALLDAADAVITFGSTVGVEATFWGKPSIMAGRALFEDLDAVYVAASHEHLMDLIGNATVPKSKLHAIQYGYYAAIYGETFSYWQARDFSDGLFKGQPLAREPKSWLLRRLVMAAKDLRRGLGTHQRRQKGPCESDPPPPRQ